MCYYLVIAGAKVRLFLITGKFSDGFFHRSGIFPWIPEQNGQQSEDSHAERVVEVANDAEWRHGCQAGSDEHLGAVGDDALHEAREGVQYAGYLAAVELEVLADVACDRACGDDGDGVVGRTQVGDAHQCGDAQFGSPLALDVVADVVEDEVDATVETSPYRGR